MIDWVTAGVYSEHVPGRRLPCKVACELDRKSGELREVRDLSVQVEGSYSDKATVWLGGGLTEHEREQKALAHLGLLAPKVWVSGNPAKWFQGHNVFGSDDCRGLADAFVLDVLRLVGWELSEMETSVVLAGMLSLSRVDCTAMLDYGSEESVQALMRHLSLFGVVKNQGRFTVKHKTLGVGYGSRRWQLKGYSKFEELKRHELDESLCADDRERLAEYSRGCLRWELQLRRPELNPPRRALGHTGAWTEETGLGELARALEGVEMPRQVEMGELAVEGLPGPLRKTYRLWSKCVDVRECVSQKTFYRHRKELLRDYGIDIGQPPAGMVFREVAPVNVEPFCLQLKGHLKGVPDWAVGTPLYFEPKEAVG